MPPADTATQQQPPDPPKLGCWRCPHSSQWHGQNGYTINTGMSYTGAPCHFPGCPCGNDLDAGFAPRTLTMSDAADA